MLSRSRTLHSILRLGSALLITALPLQIAHAQQATDFSKVQIKTSKLADNFYTLEGQGGTISVLTGPDGVLLVDSQFGPLTEKLNAAIPCGFRQADPLPGQHARAWRSHGRQ